MENIFLADGSQIITEVHDSYGKGTIDVEGHSITVERLAKPYQLLGYGELLSINLRSGAIVETVLQPQEYIHHKAIIDVGDLEAENTRFRNPGDVVVSRSLKIMAIYDQETNQWREQII